MAWTFVLTDWDGDEIGEVVDAHQRVVTRVLNGISSARFTIRGDHPLAPTVNSENVFLKCYDHDKELRFHGVVQSVEDVVQGGQYTITSHFSDSGVTLDGRVSASFEIFHANNDSGKLGRLCVFQRQRLHPTKYGIWLHANSDFYNSGNLVAWQESAHFHALQSIVELSESAAGFDWHLEPIELTNDGNGDPCINEWTSSAVIGTTKDNAVFEWGTGRNNVKEWQRVKDWSKLLNIGWCVTGEQDPLDAAGVPIQAVASDSASITEFGEHFDVIESFGVEDITFRQELADAHVQTRAQPREIYTFTPQAQFGNVPVFGVDYYLGDIVPWRAKHNGSVLFNGQVRIYSVEIEIDDNGQETAKPTVEVQ